MRDGLRRRRAGLDLGREGGDGRADTAERQARRLARALDVLPQGVVVCDETGAVAFRNCHAEALVDPRLPDALASRAVDELLAAASDGEAKTRTLELRGPPPRTLVLTASTIVDDHCGGTVAVIDDVSERRRLEAVRRDFVANVSHELRTPVGALGVLADALGEESDVDTVRRLAGRISAEVERMGRVIEDLLDLSRLEAGVSPTSGPVEVAAVIAGSLERVRPLAEQRQVGIRALDGDGDGPTVLGDEHQLVSAVANLLDNAVKYSDAGDTVEVGVRTPDGWVDIVVSDHGVGIPAKDLERIFERFYRVDRARSRRTGGTGLGLAIVRHVATNHGGEVHVRSVEGQGSCFTLRLPAAGP